jgi:hypothetical protein
MSFIEDIELHNISLLRKLDGRKFLYTPRGGRSRIIDGILQESSEFASGQSVNIVVSHMMLSVRSCDVLGIMVGDEFSFGTRNYEVSIIRPDSGGITELTLVETYAE